jgi:EAL domain-containing protein (putative c-di-GMP-specific phosphodiesterase class I)
MNRQDGALFSSLRKSIIYLYLKQLNHKSRKEILYIRRLKELQKIMGSKSLDTFFQPILNLKTGDTAAYEALNRPPVTNLFSNTEEFYEFVGQSNQVFQFECFCRNISFKRFIERFKGNPNQDASLLFINIHPNVLLDSNYHSGETLQLLCELGIDPKQVVFELTEKSAVSDVALFERVLSNYRSQGFRIAIDDVGSGYNSLKSLVFLKPEFIKLDKSLIQNIDRNREQQQLVRIIIEYARESSTDIIAEGIERMEELSYIREHGVQYGQGYALGKPNEEVIPGFIPGR